MSKVKAGQLYYLHRYARKQLGLDFTHEQFSFIFLGAYCITNGERDILCYTKTLAFNVSKIKPC
jgi:hypothetical protein